MTNINRSLFLQTTLLRSALLFQLLCVSIVILPTQQQTPSQAQLAQFNMTGNGTADYDDDEDEESITGDPFDEKTSLPETAIRDLMNLDVGFWVGYKRGPCRWYFKNKLHVIDMYYSGYGVK
nr:uncharacterized protein LOC128680607 isoform X2 [Plodia interpunctella]